MTWRTVPLALAALTGALLFARLAAGTTAAALIVPTSSSPTPCSLPPPLTCDLSSPLPTLASPSPTPTSSTSGGTTSGGTGSVGTAPGQQLSGPTKTALPGIGTVSAADLAVLQSAIGDPSLITGLLAVLENPISAQRPDLVHFDPVATRVSRPAAAAAQRLVAQSLGAGILLAVAIAALPLFALGRRGRLAAALAPAVLAAGVGAAAVLPATAAPAGFPLSASAHRASGPSRQAESAWGRLLAVEAGLRRGRLHLLAIEDRLQELTAEAADQDPTPAAHARAAARLAVLLDQHAAAQAVYDGDLQREYEIYRAAALRPDLASALLADSSAGGPHAMRAVSGDLAILQTQLQQEAAIGAAQAHLRQLGFSPAQAAALQSHDAFIAPAGGPVGQPFGPTSFQREPPLEYQGQFYPHFHTGIDVEAPAGTPVLAAADGVVALVATSAGGYGNYVMVAHAHGYFTLYAHLQTVLVGAGSLVRQGQPIGLVGTTGNSTGPHLHFEIRRDGEFLDPLPYVTGRLRPW